MAFTGIAVVTRLGRYTARIRGVSLDPGATGTIGPETSNPNVVLPADFPSVSDASEIAYELLLEVIVTMGPGANTSNDVRLVFGKFPFNIQLSNPSANASGQLDIIVRYIHSATR